MGTVTRVPESDQRETESCFAWHATDTIPTSHPGIRVGQSSDRDAAKAVRELQRALYQPYPELVVFFCSGDYDLDALATEINSCFAGTQVVGCTSEGVIGPLGYVEHSLCGLSFDSNVLAAVSGRVDQLRDLDSARAEDLVATLRDRLEVIEPDVHEQSMFALQFVDGLSKREESVTRGFQNPLGSIPLLGGSAGDSTGSGHPSVFDQGRFREDSAVLVVAASSLPFMTFCTNHLVGTDRRGVVTSVDASGRTVLEIDGLPATEGYARLCQVQVSDLGPDFFVSHPVAVRIRGIDYARSIRGAHADGSLTFRCAVEEGIVLRCAVENDLVTDLMGSFAHINREIGRPCAVFMCDSVQRSAEIAQLGMAEPVAALLRRHNAVGFSTQGSQSDGIHLNQALVGIAFGQGGTE